MTTRDAALECHKRGWSPLPVPDRSKNPGFEGWQNLDLDSVEKIKARFNCAPQNIGVRLGKPSSGLVDADLDFLEARTLADAYLPDTLRSGRRSKPDSHRFFYAEPIPETRQFEFKDAMVVEIRSTGVQTIIPPSVHPDGEPITWSNNLDPVRISGDELLRLAGIIAAGALLANSWPKTHGVRDKIAIALAGGLLRAEWSIEQAERFILAVCRAAGDEEAEARSQKPRHTGAKIETEQPTTGWRTLGDLIGKDIVAKVRDWLGAQREPVGSTNLTDLANARRLVEQHRDELRYVHILKKWNYWTGTHWHKDETGEVERRAKATVKSIYEEAAQATSKEDRRGIANHAARSESAGKIRAMIELAQSENEFAITPDLLDTNPMLLNVANGTIDLETGRLRSHDRHDHITRVIPIDYDQDALCPLFDRFLAEILSSGLIDFLQLAVGYSLTGLTTEQVFLILFGLGSNGKSVLLEVLRTLLADYASVVRVETLMVNKRTEAGSAPTSDIACLKGARLVTASECEEGQRLAESRIKELSGCDEIKARHLFFAKNSVSGLSSSFG
jgi:putative DNA primase/helicase